MSAQIDVLAVMDRLEDYYRRHEVLIGPVDDVYSVEHKAARLAVAELIDCHMALYRHYVNTLESGRDRIIELGGDCDPVDRMEQSDPVLARSRAALANVGGAK